MRTGMAVPLDPTVDGAVIIVFTETFPRSAFGGKDGAAFAAMPGIPSATAVWEEVVGLGNFPNPMDVGWTFVAVEPGGMGGVGGVVVGQPAPNSATSTVKPATRYEKEVVI
jgi:hypothetical protein